MFRSERPVAPRPASVAMWARLHTRTLIAAAARRLLEPFRASRVPLVLGGDHPLSRMATFVHVLAWQLAATSGVVAGGGAGGPRGPGRGIRPPSAGPAGGGGRAGPFSLARPPPPRTQRTRW